MTLEMKPVTLILVLLTAYIIDALSFPQIITKGTHYEVGNDIGRTFKKQIQQYYKTFPQLPTFLQWSNTFEGHVVLNGYLSVLKQNFPQYLRELQGISDGACVPFHQVLIMNYQMEISAITGGIDKAPSRCSDVHLFFPNNSYISIGHNEDTTPMVKDLGYFVTAHIVDNESYPHSKVQTKEEMFTAYSYPGILPGNAFAFNRHGIIQTLNALYPTLVGYNKTGRNILTRATLAATSVEQILKLLRDEGVGITYGISMNLGILPSKENKLQMPEIWNIEVAPTSEQISEVNAMNILCEGSYGNYYHVNNYRRIKIPQNAKKIKSSLARAQRIEQLFPVKSNPDILNILGDTKNRELPIYRTPRPTDEESTVATGFFDLIKKTLNVYKDNPKYHSTSPVITFSLDWDLS